MFLLETCPCYSIYENGKDYIFYNSIRHLGCRLSKLEMLILDLKYKYKNNNFIENKFSSDYRHIINKCLNRIDELDLLNTEKLIFKENLLDIKPITFYIHLTYNCNLKCSYCYNQNIRRKNKKFLNFSDWKIILDKIIPSANSIIFTGGECFLHHEMKEIVQYIKNQKNSIRLSCISNGMNDYSRPENKEILNILNSINLSCDSIDIEGERIGFNPILFKENIEYIRNNHPNTKVTIAATCTRKNINQLSKIENFCKLTNCQFSKNVVIPETIEDIDLMPNPDDLLEKVIKKRFQESKSKLFPPRVRCGAGKEVWSIDPLGNVYPCQSLHFDNMYMGNLLRDELTDIRFYQTMERCLPSVDDIPECSICNVKYICGGGCLASSYHMNGYKPGRNHLTCQLNHANSILHLKSLNNRISNE